MDKYVNFEMRVSYHVGDSFVYRSRYFKTSSVGVVSCCLCACPEIGMAWLELDPVHSLLAAGNELDEARKNVLTFGMLECKSWEDFNGLLLSFGDDAYSCYGPAFRDFRTNNKLY